MVRVQSLAWELPHAVGAEKKKKIVFIKICFKGKKVTKEYSIAIKLMMRQNNDGKKCSGHMTVSELVHCNVICIA